MTRSDTLISFEQDLDRSNRRWAKIVSLIVAALFLFSSATAAQQDMHSKKKVAKAVSSAPRSYSQMLAKGEIRLAVTYDRTLYLNVKGQQQGLSVDMTRAFEQWMNEKYASRQKQKIIKITIVPSLRKDLFTKLRRGEVDIVLGDLGLYQETSQSSGLLEHKFFKPEHEVLVTGPNSLSVKSLEDLSGKTVYVGRNTNFYASFAALNIKLIAENKLPITLVSPVGKLDDEDLLEMLNDGLIPFVIVSQWKADLWQQIYSRLVVHHDLAADDSGWLGWAVRKANPELLKDLEAFENSPYLARARQAFRLSNNKMKTQGLKDPLTKPALSRYESMKGLFNKFGEQYHLDPLFLAALGFQETELDQSAIGPNGAIGVMQLMPTTGESMGTGDIHEIGPNIDAAAKYLEQLLIASFPRSNLHGDNRSLFAIASYNLGSSNLAKAVTAAKKFGFDTNEWFGNVEFMAAEAIGLEPTMYVRNVYKYFISYQLYLKEITVQQP